MNSKSERTDNDRADHSGEGAEHVDQRTEALDGRVGSPRDARSRQRYLTSILDSIGSILFVVDADMAVTFVNQRGRELARDGGDGLMDKLPCLESCRERIQNVVQGGGAISGDRVEMVVGDVVRHFELSVRPLRSEGIDGDAGGGVVCLEDVTDTVRLQEMLFHSEKMNSIGSLAAGMAHEINNPLSAVSQNIQVIRLRLDNDNQKNRTEAQKAGTSMDAINTYLRSRRIDACIAGVEQSTVQAANVVARMLSFARKTGAASELYQVSELVDETIAIARSDYSLKSDFDFKKVRIVRDYHNAPSVCCDSTKLQQVILTLLQNSAQAIWEHRCQNNELVPQIDISVFSDESGVLLVVKDNGVGMDAAVQRRVFDPFFTTRPMGTGTGLGLSTAYFIIKHEHKGDIALSSSLGEGTTVTIRLPFDEEG